MDNQKATIWQICLILSFYTFPIPGAEGQADSESVEFREAELGEIGKDIESSLSYANMHIRYEEIPEPSLYIAAFTKLLLDERLSTYLTQKDIEILRGVPMPEHRMFSKSEVEELEVFCSDAPDFDALRVEELASSFSRIFDQSEDRVTQYYRANIVNKLSSNGRDAFNRQVDPATTSISINAADLDLVTLSESQPVFVGELISASCDRAQEIESKELFEVYLEDKLVEQ